MLKPEDLRLSNSQGTWDFADSHNRLAMVIYWGSENWAEKKAKGR